MSKSIIIIIGYFGKFPWYFNYFLHSCRYNPNIDFFIITDNKFKTNHIPTNVYHVSMTLEEIKQIASKKLGFEIGLEQPYKFCDFRPALAYLFPEIVKGYDFWGYGDIDVIFGNIRNFMTNEILDSNDVVSVRHDYLAGVFSIFKNCKKVNELFQRSKDYIKVFTDSKHYCFDETNFKFKEFAEGLDAEEIESEIESMTHLVKKMHSQKYLNAYFDFNLIEGLPGKMKWDKGVLTYKNSYEVVLYHLIKLKAVYTPLKPPKNIPETFYISQSRIYTR